MTDTSCFICKKHRGEIPRSEKIFESDNYRVYHISPSEDSKVYLGYIFIETIRHISNLSSLNEGEAGELGVLLSRLSRVFVEQFNAEKAYSFVLGDHVPHFHMHVIPRYKGTPPKYRGFDIDSWPEAPKGDITDIKEFCKKFRSYL